MDVNIFSKRIAKGAIIVFFGLLLSKTLAYLYVALLARLGSSEYGTLSLALAIISFISIFAILGLKTGIVRYVSYYKGKQDYQKLKGTIISSLRLSLPINIVLMILLLIFSDEISISIFHNANLIPILRLFSFALPFITLSDIFLGIIIGFQKIQYKVLVKDILENIFKLVLTFVVIYFGYNLFGVAIIYGLSIIVTTILSYYLLQKKVFPFFKTKVIPIFITKELFLFSLPFIFAGVLDLVIKWTDIFMIGFFRTTSEVGIYNVVLPTANLLIIIPTAFMALFIPIITEFYSKNNLKEINNISNINSKWIFFLNFPIFLLLLLFSKQILTIMFGQEYVVGNLALIILIIGYMFLSLVHIPNSLLIMLKKTKLVLYISLISASINIILNYFLIPKLGIVGGAIATSSSLILIFVLTLIGSYNLTKIQPIKINYLKSVLAGVIPFFMILFIINSFKINIGFLLFVLFSIIFLLIYALLVYLFKGLDKEDIEVINGIYTKFRKRKYI